MFKRLTNFFVSIVQKYLPDPFLFAILLTLIVFIGGVFATDSTPINMIDHWGSGFWGLLAFSMQMALVLVLGHVMASSAPVKKVLKSIASIPSSPGSSIIIVSLVSAVACWVNWGFGLVVGALLAKEVARIQKGVDYRLLIASAYSGFLVWHAGISGSMPLTIATEGHDFQDVTGLVSTSETIFSSTNLIISIVLIALLPIINRLMMPQSKDVVEVDPKLLEDDLPEATTKKHQTPAEFLENFSLISFVIGFMGVVYIVYYFAIEGGSLDLNIVNFIFLFMGILFHKTPKNYLHALRQAVKGAGGILIQFPFYAGIMGMMVESGLAAQMTELFINISTETTFPLFAFLSAGIVNFFVPSGGGQWAVQAPIMIPASIETGVEISKTVIALSWGDAWTNMIQPFWALPALGIAGLGARDIMGYCLMILFISGIVISLGLVLL
ncbi:short-chain fatty acid transporter [Proteinivorax hydrogeniformans]|uniref:Short-chain fatty acid transporter n=1 Tax=Proteinivorax hydrogeniformans TaxID=1826727 RepID=A0AAU8HUL9_9FIRM